MKNNKFNFCPECGSKNIQTLMNGRKWLCPDCGFDLYNNVASAVGLIILKDGKALFEKRAKEPRKGFLALPGGFCNPDESAETGALRECLEETGCEASSLKYIASFPNTYVYKEIEYKTCDIFFLAELDSSSKLKPQAGEVESFEWHKISSADDVEELPLAFGSAALALKKWLLLYGENNEK